MRIEEVAKVCHQANMAICECYEDLSQSPWDEAPEWQKESAINGVKFHLAHPEACAATSHENWMAEKERAGWKYGKDKNETTKEHPCMIAYHKLPKKQRVKDYVFRQIIESLKPFVNQALVAEGQPQ